MMSAPPKGSSAKPVPSAERGVERALRGEQPAANAVVRRGAPAPTIRPSGRSATSDTQSAAPVSMRDHPDPPAVGRVELPRVGAELGHDAVRTRADAAGLAAPEDDAPVRPLRRSPQTSSRAVEVHHGDTEIAERRVEVPGGSRGACRRDPQQSENDGGDRSFSRITVREATLQRARARKAPGRTVASDPRWCSPAPPGRRCPSARSAPRAGGC